MFEKLKKRWNIQSNFQVVIILIVFAITGSSTVYLKRIIFDWIQIAPDMHAGIKIPVNILVILVVYNLLLLIVGFVFGQFRFFWEFEKKFFSRFLIKKKQTSSEKVNSL
ncbi:MAG TPA: DUF6787 family protein [Draconibacterium sp.]|nr:DUF6787 family protein [Draconibacterium sp.]